jgi:hypothetical protein
MATLAQVVDGWHDFYMMVGTAAATLIGLLFVSLSLNADVITRDESDGLRSLAAQAFTSFLNVAIVAVLFVIPDQGHHGLGLPLLGVSAYGLYETVRRFVRTRHAHPHLFGTAGGIAWRFAVPAVCYMAVVAVALSVLWGQTAGLYWLVPVMIILIVGASRSAWDLLMGLRRTPQDA